jgi:hypothetical protein
MPTPPSRSLLPRSAAMAITALIVLAGCATVRGPAEETPAVSCVLLAPADVWGYATADEANPFLAPAGLLRGTPSEFVVLRLTLSLREESRIAVSAEARDAAGNKTARLYSASDMRDLWKAWGDETSLPHLKRAETLDRWCLPATGFTRRAGRGEYVLVLVGKKPLPRPALVDVAVTVGDAEPAVFTFTLPKGT